MRNGYLNVSREQKLPVTEASTATVIWQTRKRPLTAKPVTTNTDLL